MARCVAVACVSTVLITAWAQPATALDPVRAVHETIKQVWGTRRTLTLSSSTRVLSGWAGGDSYELHLGSSREEVVTRPDLTLRSSATQVVCDLTIPGAARVTHKALSRGYTGPLTGDLGRLAKVGYEAVAGSGYDGWPRLVERMAHMGDVGEPWIRLSATREIGSAPHYSFLPLFCRKRSRPVDASGAVGGHLPAFLETADHPRLVRDLVEEVEALITEDAGRVARGLPQAVEGAFPAWMPAEQNF